MKYVALLRGINISGKNKISMAELKKIFEENGYKNVKTLLNSGNVIFDFDAVNTQSLMSDISKIIKNKFGFNIPVFVLTATELKEVLSNHPCWWNTPDKNIYNNLIFIIPPTTYKDIFDCIGNPSVDIDQVENYKNYIFWSFDLKNYRKSNWWVKTASVSFKDQITIRTANTMYKILALCGN